eukprot:TRINITY_DN21105_c0_g1_i1.p1 TRINITY_DN21105_c0_g1~~TRINITY_DN21105_c0_g1_i1.p1  ORF type:complete len:396 (+),score=49.07 TRINITY_DN21105_c0_g1_i1:80-1267(+)
MPKYNAIPGYIGWVRSFRNSTFRRGHGGSSVFIASRWLREGRDPSPLKVFKQLTWEADHGKGVTLSGPDTERYLSAVLKSLKQNHKSCQKRVPRAYQECEDILEYASHYHNINKGCYLELLKIAACIKGPPGIAKIFELIDRMHSDASIPPLTDTVVAQAITCMAKVHDIDDKLTNVDLLLAKCKDVPMTECILQAHHFVVAIEKGLPALEAALLQTGMDHPAVTLSWRYYYHVAWGLRRVAEKKKWLTDAVSKRNITFPQECVDIWMSCSDNPSDINNHIQQAQYQGILSVDLLRESFKLLSSQNTLPSYQVILRLFNEHHVKYALHKYKDAVETFLQAALRIPETDPQTSQTIKHVVTDDLLNNSDIHRLYYQLSVRDGGVDLNPLKGLGGRR